MNKLAVIVLLLGLAACSKKKPEEGREPAQMASPGAAVGGPAPGAPAANPGAASGGTPTSTAAPGTGSAGGAAGTAASPAVGCATAATLGCDAGQVDGCTGGLTTVHLCVAKDTKAGSPCAQAPAATCPAGQVDACLHDPPQSNNHVCVIVPKPTP